MKSIDSVEDRVDEIESLIAQDEITRSQVFTQMKQLMQYAKVDINKIRVDALNDATDYADEVANDPTHWCCLIKQRAQKLKHL